MKHAIEIKVRGYHADMYGHVNNARYLEFLEEARWAAIEEIAGFRELLRKNYTFNAVNININYRKPALPGDMLIIESEVTKINSRSAVVNQNIKLKGADTVIADADVTFVIYDLKLKKAAELEGELFKLLETL